MPVMQETFGITEYFSSFNVLTTMALLGPIHR